MGVSRPGECWPIRWIGALRAGIGSGPRSLGVVTIPEPESVWDYPRPPKVEPSDRRIGVFLDGRMLADTTSSQRVLETSHPPVYYIPLADIVAGALEPSRGRGSYCEWKGAAIYYDVIGPEGRRVERAGWGYPKPS